MDSALFALQAFPLFAPLPQSTLANLTRIAIVQDRPVDTLIQIEGEPAEAMYLVMRGQVKVMRTSPNGREQVLHIAGPGQSINMVPVFDGGANPATLQALTPIVLLTLPMEALRGLLRTEPELSMAFLTDLAARQRRLVNLVDDLALHTVQGRLAKLLIERAESAERGVPVMPLTQADMANRLGTVREMISRSLRTFEALGLIELKQGAIVLKDRAGLEERTSE